MATSPKQQQPPKRVPNYQKLTSPQWQVFSATDKKVRNGHKI